MSNISVIVPVYNVKPYLRFCLDSILSQTYRDFELFLIDDGSTDGTSDICDVYCALDARITVVHQPNRGVSAARNTGIDMAFSQSESQWITFVDSDDYVREDYLEVLLNLAERNHVLISSGAYGRTFSHGGVKQNSSHNEAAITPNEFYCWRGTCQFISRETVWNRLYAKSLFREIRFPEGKLFEDSFTVYKLLFLCDKLAVTDEVIYYFFNNPKGIVNSPWSPDKLVQLDALEQQLVFFSENHAKYAYSFALRVYIGALVQNLKKIKKQPEYAGYRMDCRKKLRNLLRKYAHRLGYTPGNSYDAFYSAYPLWTNLFFKTLKILQCLRLDGIAKRIPAEQEMRIARKHLSADIHRTFLVDKKNHTVYLINYKVASSSIQAAMHETLYPDDYSVHHHYNDGYIETVLLLTDEEKTWNSFTFVRNPYDRLISAYECHYHKDSETVEASRFAGYLHDYLVSDRGFDSFVKRVCRIPDSILNVRINSQYRLTHYPDGAPVVRWIGKYENLTEDFAKIAEKCGYRPLPHYNNSGGTERDWRNYYTPRTAKLVHEKYKKDFEAFGYENSYTELMEYLRSKHR